MRLLLVGEAPGPSGTGDAVAGRAAAFLAPLAGLTVDEFLERFERTNLLTAWPGPAGEGSAFPIEKARDAFLSRLSDFFERRVIFLGRSGQAAGLTWLSYFTWTTWHVSERHGFQAARLPHPSGLNRLWNSQEVKANAAAFLRRALVEE